jgi:ubiquinone/menaquinone biosynthesis C-methylase UbiE
MTRADRVLPCLILALASMMAVQFTLADTNESTRVTDERFHARSGPSRSPYRAKAEYVLKELDLKNGDVVVDIGAGGEAWWSERFAQQVGPKGVVYAAEISESKVNSIAKKFANLPQLKPHLCKTDSIELPENSCDLAFLSQTYHHLNKGGHVDYLRHLRTVIKPTGRICIIERYSKIATRKKSHGTNLSTLTQQAEEAGWIPVRCELIRGTYHHICILVQEDLFPPES